MLLVVGLSILKWPFIIMSIEANATILYDYTLLDQSTNKIYIVKK